MLKYVLSTLAIVMVWAVCIYLEVHWAVPLAFTLLVAGALIGWVVFQRLRARRAARELERGLAAQALDQAKNARPDLQAEIQQMQGEFAKAVQALRSSKLGRSGVDALYALPWYVIVGPPGSGKTTALRESGLEFPMTSTRGGLRGLGGTRNCDWWLTNQGVLLDTAGRWTDAEDKDEWVGFLDLIKRSRPRKPLNGIIVAVSVADLGNAQDADIQSLSRRVRDRIDEILGRLQLRLPVYVLFTKCDLVPGFVETFRDFGTPDRSQIWGATVPVEEKTEAGELFRARFDELQRTLESFTLKRMGEVQKIEDREQVFGFPQQLQVLRENLAQFIGATFKDNIYQETPVLRGVYFTSGTQEGRPIDRVMRRMAEAFGLRTETNLPAPAVEAKSYFLRDVFANVVFKDAELAGHSVAEERRRSRSRMVAAGSIFGLALFVSSLPTWAWWNNRALISSTAEIVDAVEVARQAGPTTPVTLEALEDLRARAELLRTYQAEGPPVGMRFGMYEGDTIAPRVVELYADTLREQVLQPILSADLDQLDEFGRRYEALADVRPSGPEHAGAYEVLKSYLLLTQPTEDSQPALDPTLQAWVSSEIVDRWAEQTAGPGGDPSQVSAGERARMATHASFFISLLASDASLAFPRDEQAVQRARVALTRVPQASLILERLIQELEPSGYGLTLRSLIGPSVTAMTARSSVRAAFTRRAWESRVRDMLEEPPSSLTGEGWVLGPEAARAAQDEAQRDLALRGVASEYFRQYIEEWQEFVRGVRVSAPDGEVRSLTTLQDLTRGEPPALGRFIRQVHYNVQLPYPEPPPTEDPNVIQAVVDGVAPAVQRAAPRTARAVRALRGVHDALDHGAAAADDDLLAAEDVTRAFEGLTTFAVAAGDGSDTAGQSTSLAVYQEQLAFVRDALQTQLENPQERDALIARLQTARMRVRSLIEEQEVGWRPRFEALLWPPIDGASLGSTRAAALGAGRGWCTDVVQPHSRNIAGRFPFVAAGQDASLVDFSEFFKRDGTLWTYYGESLDDAVERQGDGFSFTTRLGRDASLVYARNLPAFLQRARDVTESFFPPGSDTPRADFDVQVLPTPDVATIALSVGGTTVSYENGPERWERLSWPGEAPEQGAVLEMRGANGMVERLEQEGEWGLFHLLEAGTVESADQRVFTVVFRVRTQGFEVRLSIRPVRGDNPFFGVVGREPRPRFMQPVRAAEITVPREIAAGQTLCRP